MKQAVHDEYREQFVSHWWFRARRSIFERFLAERVALPPAAHILDIGPGGGVNLPVLGRLGEVTVLDLDRGSLEHCRTRGATHVVLGDACAPPLGPATVDLISALDVLEHLPDDRAALAAWRALLRPNGQLLLSVPALAMLWGRQDVLAGHYRRYRRPALRDRLTEAGFHITRLTYFNTLLFPPILATRLAMRPFLRRSVARGKSDLSTPRLGLDGALYRLFAAEGGWLAKRDLPVGVSLLALAHPA